MKIFKAYLGKYQFNPYIHIASEYKEILDNDFTKDKAKVYFFIKSKAIFSELAINEFSVNGKVINNDSKINIQFNICSFLGDLLLKIYDNNKNNIKHHVKEREAEKIADYILASMNLDRSAYSQRIDLSLGNGLFTYRDPILGGNTMPVHIYQLINSELLTLKDIKTDILYIGKSDSVDGILKGRIFNHEKSGHILGELGMKNDYLSVFMFEICVDPSIKIDKEIYIPCVEEILIRYFKPKYNKDYLMTKKGSSKHIEKLMNLGFTDCCIELNFDDDICSFGTEVRTHSKKHIISEKLSDIHNI